MTTSSPNEPADWQRVVRCMWRARLTEERLVRLYHQGRIFGGVYTGIGQEAIGAATACAGGPDDLFAPCIRDMTVHLARGISVLDIFRQYLGRATGPTRGRDGNVHYGDLAKGVFTMISHLGAMLSVITGGVMARRRLGRPTIGMAYLGDGATSTGDFHEAINFAAVFDVPVIFVIENNKFAYSTPTERQYRCARLSDRAIGYGIEGITTDGNDVVALHRLALRLANDIRERPRPILLECDTMRMRGHGEHDDCSYVPRQLLEEYAERDPLTVARRRLATEGLLSEADFDRIREEVRAEVETAYHQALSEPAPDPASLLHGVYADA